MTDLKTLEEIWKENDRKPVEVFEIHSVKQAKILVGLIANVGIIENGNGQLIKFASDERCWKLYTEPKRLWPAIYTHEDEEKSRITLDLYETVEEARKHRPKINIVRLANADDFANGFLVED